MNTPSSVIQASAMHSLMLQGAVRDMRLCRLVSGNEMKCNAHIAEPGHQILEFGALVKQMHRKIL